MISVIVPVYNVEGYLDECITSVIDQTYKNYELILVNDGSTDTSGQICDQYSRQYSNIKTVHSDNQGALSARIQGIRLASGNIIVFLDGDDCLEPNALELLYNCFQENSCDMVIYNTGTCKNFETLQNKHPFKHGTVFEKEAFATVYQQIVCAKIPNSICTKAIKIECALSLLNLELSKEIKQGEDLVMSLYCLENTKKLVFVDWELYWYRKNAKSIVHSYDSKRKNSIKEVNYILSKYIEKWDMPELVPMHNTRKVKGWIETLNMLVANRERFSKESYELELKMMAEDSYFRDAYINADLAQLKRIYYIMAFFLYHKNYKLLNLLYYCRKWKNNILLK